MAWFLTNWTQGEFHLQPVHDTHEQGLELPLVNQAEWSSSNTLGLKGGHGFPQAFKANAGTVP
jgi:hypothetical protein